MNTALACTTLAVSSYLIGGIPWGYIVVKILKGVDVRNYGSGNIGATNVRRVAGNAACVVVFALDVAKGFVPVFVVARLFGSLLPYPIPGGALILQVISGLSSILGHMYTPYLGFKGGKGVATSCGVFFGLAPIPALWAFGVWVGVLAIWKYVSLASIAAAVCLPLALILTDPRGALGEKKFLTLLCVAAAGLVIFRHRSNIVRLLKGTEPKVGQRQ